MTNPSNFRDPVQVQAFVEDSFADDPKRLAHILKVAELVRETGKRLNDKGAADLDLDLLYCAALLHDIGYIPQAQQRGFHPVDGYTYLSEQGYPELAELIVEHSNAPEQAAIRGIEMPPVPERLESKLITYWDVRVLQGGEVVSYQQRLDDILSRYGEDHPVTHAHQKAQPRILTLISEIDGLLEVEN